MENKEIERIINEVMQERSITVKYFNNNQTVRVSSPEMTLIGSSKVFDEAVKEAAKNWNNDDNI